MASKVKPRICRTNEINIPIDTEECVLWLNPVQSIDDIKNPTRDFAWITPDNTVYVYNGHKIVPIFSANDSHIKWGHIDGDIKDQIDLYNILLKSVNGVKQNGTELTKDLEQKVNVSVPIMRIKVNNTELEPNDYTVNIDLTPYAKTSDIPTKLSQLANDTGYITPETEDVPIKTITLNGALLNPDEHKNVSINIRTLKSVSTTYQASTSDTNIPTGTWNTTIPKLDAQFQHLWTKTVYTYSDGSTETSYTVSTTHSGIQVGGRNLFYNSSLSENLDRIRVVNSGLTSNFTTEDGFKCLHVAGKNTNDSFYIATLEPPMVKQGDVYTISADFKFKNITKGPSTNNFSLYGFYVGGEDQDGAWKAPTVINRYNMDNNVSFNTPIESGSQDWKRLGITAVYNYAPTRPLDINVYFRNFTGEVYVKNIKLERGNIPTDWTPAPEDLEAYTDSKATEINNTLSTYAKKTDMPTKVSQLTNDSGYVTTDKIDVPIKTITVNGDLLVPDENKNVSINISGGGTDFSESATKTGEKWIDGKPIYKITKKWIANNKTVIAPLEVPHGISNIDTIVNCNAFYTSDDLKTEVMDFSGSYIGIPGFAITTDSNMLTETFLSVDKTSWGILAKQYANLMQFTPKIYVTIYYTLTTD